MCHDAIQNKNNDGNGNGKLQAELDELKKKLAEKDVAYKKCLASFTSDPHKVELKNAKGDIEYATGRRIVVAVGGRPTPIRCPGGELALSSDDLFSMKSPPGKTLVVGASYIALECAGFLAGLGFDVTVMVRSILLRGFDRDCVERIHRDMRILHLIIWNLVFRIIILFRI